MPINLCACYRSELLLVGNLDKTYKGGWDYGEYRRNKKIFMFSIGFGLLIGVSFIFYAPLLTNFKNPTCEIIFNISCAVAGVVLGISSFLFGKKTLISSWARCALCVSSQRRPFRAVRQPKDLRKILQVPNILVGIHQGNTLYFFIEILV